MKAATPLALVKTSQLYCVRFFKALSTGPKSSGGPMSMVEWASHEPAYGRGDHVHFTYVGHARLAEVLEDALLEGY
jgi:lysophospholipase L1-like esterase